jgi:hypothetical protein
MAKHAGGRPTKYNSLFIKQIEEYLATCGREQTKLPKRVDIALLLGVDDETLIEWEKKYPEFSATLKKVDQTQLGELIDDGLFGGKEVNANVAIFLMKANHGMMETDKKIVTGDNGPLEIVFTEDKKLPTDNE